MSDSGCKEHLESLFEKYLNGDESSAKEFAAYAAESRKYSKFKRSYMEVSLKMYNPD